MKHTYNYAQLAYAKWEEAKKFLTWKSTYVIGKMMLESWNAPLRVFCICIYPLYGVYKDDVTQTI